MGLLLIGCALASVLAFAAPQPLGTPRVFPDQDTAPLQHTAPSSRALWPEPWRQLMQHRAVGPLQQPSQRTQLLQQAGNSEERKKLAAVTFPTVPTQRTRTVSTQRPRTVSTQRPWTGRTYRPWTVPTWKPWTEPTYIPIPDTVSTQYGTTTYVGIGGGIIGVFVLCGRCCFRGLAKLDAWEMRKRRMQATVNAPVASSVADANANRGSADATRVHGNAVVTRVHGNAVATRVHGNAVATRVHGGGTRTHRGDVDGRRVYSVEETTQPWPAARQYGGVQQPAQTAWVPPVPSKAEVAHQSLPYYAQPTAPALEHTLR